METVDIKGNAMTDDDIEKIKTKIYNLYQLHWMMLHEYSIEDILSIIENNGNDHDEDEDLYPCDAVHTCCNEFREDLFGGTGYVCYDEFLGAEFLDKQYMTELISFSNPTLLPMYLQILQAEKESN